MEFLYTSILGSLIVFAALWVFSLFAFIRREQNFKKKIDILIEELSFSNKRLKELDQRKAEFIALASHQLRGPLGTIKGYASMLLEGSFGDIPPKARVAIDRIFRSSNRLTTIADDFLTVSRFEQDKLSYHFTKVDITEIVREMLQELESTIEEKELSVVVETGDKQAYLNGDPGKLAQMVRNILSNAVTYTDHGKIIVRVAVHKDRRVVLFSVEDTGIGMTRETINEIFQKFSRAENALRVDVAGTGLGLYVARQIAEAHGGYIWAESPGEGKGSTFYVEIPLEKNSA